ncbi:cobyric acid synthase [Hansschlegelia quercus]|uniref:Cobyric acid synthase n=1 Tax=Hansschlegelia quercus TaxID=2528245 RepID=A0A4Q9GK85_9HYPH|nr:cobyric acid synthase [Hansschlegelia quercus]TBN54588.1 cobyric acid synthase [Hansschlegelia quercus]
MFQGTGSNVGKSLIVAGLCRAFARRGLSVAPFKPQNMSNNAAVTADGGEIGRAQALQARAAGLEPMIDMNPVLLKPESETGSQVVVQGRRVGSYRGRAYTALKPTLMPAVLESFDRLSAGRDLMIVEGAGSAAEVNLRAGDIANMGFAASAGVPVVLVGDVDRGGVIATLVGAHALLPPDDRARVKGYLINRFRGDVSLFDDGLAAISSNTGWSSFGIVPWFSEAGKLPAEDSADLASRARGSGQGAKIVALALPRIANFDDLDPLSLEPGVSLELLALGAPIPVDASLVLIPGSKATIADLAALKGCGWEADIRAHVRRGGRVFGLCGGYQMLGRTVADPDGVEGEPGVAEGLGLLDVETTLTGDKTLARVFGRHEASGARVEAYEIHLGRTSGPDTARAPFVIDGRPEGAVSADGRVAGTYLHGVFAADGFRKAFLETLGVGAGGFGYDSTVDETLDRLAEHLEAHLDLDALLTIARGRR